MKGKQIKIVVFLGVLIFMGTYIGLIPTASCQLDWGSQIQQWGQQASQAASDFGQQASQAASNLGQQIINQAQQQGTLGEQAMNEWVNQVTQVASQNIQEAINIAKQTTGTYQEQAWNIVSLEAQRNLCYKYTSSESVDALDLRRSLITEVAITAIKLLPVYDEDNHQLETFDGLARSMVSETPALAGSDLGKDPVRCAALMVLDGDYLQYAKIIQTPEGNWISIEQALAGGYRTSEVNSAKSTLTAAEQAYANNNARQVESYVVNFSSQINNINNFNSSEADNNTNQNSEPIINSQSSDTTKNNQDPESVVDSNQNSKDPTIDILSLISSTPTRWIILIGIVIVVGAAGVGLVQRKKKQYNWEEAI